MACMETKKVRTGRPSHRLEDNTEMELTKNRMESCELDSFAQDSDCDIVL